MSANAHKKALRIAYHWPISENHRSGIARYIKKITTNLSAAEFKFSNLADSSEYPTFYLTRFLCLFDLFFPFLRIRRKKIDVFWGAAHKLPLFCVKGVPYIVTIHDLVWKTCPKTMPLTRRLTERFFFPIAIRNADIILAVSKSTASDITKHYASYASKVKIIPLAGMVDISEMTDSSCLQEYILFVGIIEPRKNIHNMLRAYADLPKKLKERYKLYIVGSVGWGGIKLPKLISELNLNAYVKWEPLINDYELTKLYRHAYCLILPSLYEGFGLPILEAQNYGVPVITSNISSMPEVVGDGGMLIDPISIQDIKNAMKKLLSDTKLRNTLSKKAKANSLKFSWERTLKATSTAFSEAKDLKLRTDT